ncbi:GNAT family N-acetyltransferase [Bacillaceae bacterium SIJ1]|uniref:GNAT family N-acetyltransferase n=1 Tax=Litoribacterium kuwaitense TaxID=1398745 RepID=UPI0013EA6844|nr:GNAT family N-acetyltransferase [Litoribacterium kuwaitense]NGP44625.1 GNAT family N-acetyltransferase [Litoribacterium kuwaitense]
MLTKVRLIQPDVSFEKAYLEFYYDWENSGRPMIPSVIKEKPVNFQNYVKKLNDQAKGCGLPEGHVPQSTYWLIDDEKQVLGAVNIRHELTPYLERVGGHIGFGLRPSARGKGYATTMLALTLEKAKNLGLKKVLITCDFDNVASERTILQNGGRRSADEQTEEGVIIHRFWIDL